MAELELKGKTAKTAARKLATLPSACKDKALRAMADGLQHHAAQILSANEQDMENGRAKGLPAPLLDRLLLTEERIAAMADGLRQIAQLPDPVGGGLGAQQRPNGLRIHKVRVPLGVIGIIYEARPNVTVDAAGLCLKSGNAALLRGGSEAIHSNLAIGRVLAKTLEDCGLPAGCIQLVENTDRQAVLQMLRLNRYIDVVIPRGGAGLIRTVVENSTVPVIETGTGICHTYVDSGADLAMAQRIILNAKASRPGVCNALETLLVHRNAAAELLPSLLPALKAANVEVRGCSKTLAYGAEIAATEEDWATEYLDYILSVKIVDGLDEAIEHIDAYSTRHSEAIVTRDYAAAQRFLQEVDAAAVYVNASTRFTDGGEFGFGAEIGISTQKLHARGPMGLAELTSYKYLIYGDGQIR